MLATRNGYECPVTCRQRNLFDCPLEVFERHMLENFGTDRKIEFTRRKMLVEFPYVTNDVGI